MILIIVVWVVMVVLLCWKEISRQNRRWLVWRLLASSFAVASLAFIIDPAYRSKEIRTGKQFLLTEGYDESFVQKLISGDDSTIKFYTLDPDIYTANKKIHLISDYKLPARANILGWGLNEQELSAVDSGAFTFNPPLLSSGVLFADWTRRIFLGDKFRVQGSYRNTGNVANRLLLVANDQIVDSVEMVQGKDTIFSLSFVPGQIGKSDCRLISISGKDTISNDRMPFELKPGKKNEVLILAAVPGFETKFLKNWLGDNGYRVGVRTRISKQKFQREFINKKEESFSSISLSVLKDVNLVIADAEELRQLAIPELSVIQREIEQNGMGLIVRRDSVAGNQFYNQGIRTIFYMPQETGLVWGTNDSTLLPAPAKLALQPSSFSQVLVTDLGLQKRESLLKTKPSAFARDQGNAIFSASTLAGAGKIVSITLDNTYSIALSGSAQKYGSLWSHLVSSALKSNDIGLVFRTEPVFATAGKPAELVIANAEHILSGISLDGVSLPLAGDVDNLNTYHSQIWPASAGWKLVNQNDSCIGYIFIHPANTWKTANNYRKEKLTEEFVNAGRQTKKGNGETITTRERLPLWPFFLLFILCAGFLWLENKYADEA